MALNENIKNKIANKASNNQAVHDAIINILKGVDESKQLKRIVESILKTI